MGICRILDQIITSETIKRLYFIKYNRFIVLVDNFIEISNISFTPVDFLKVNKSIQLII